MTRVARRDSFIRGYSRGRGSASRPPGGRIAGPAVELTQLRRYDTPATLGQRKLLLEHARIDRERVDEHERAARPGGAARQRVETAKTAYCGHAAIVNVPPPRVESEKPAATNPAAVNRSTML